MQFYGEFIVAKQNDQITLKLWQAGAPLNRSWLTYAHPDLKSKWTEAQEKSAIEAFEQDAASVAKLKDTTPLEKTTLLFSGTQKILSEREALRKELQANTLHYIETGVLFGYGFEPPRTLGSIPVEIPKALWRGKCHWDKSTLETQGLKFIEVRLTMIRTRNDILGRGNVDATPTNPAGRPSVGPAIEDAFHALNKAGEINVNNSQMSHYPKVRKWLEMNFPNLSVSPAKISDKTIQRHFSILFNSLKKS